MGTNSPPCRLVSSSSESLRIEHVSKCFSGLFQLYQSSAELQKGFNPNASYGESYSHNTAMHYAARHGMKHLLRFGLHEKNTLRVKIETQGLIQVILSAGRFCGNWTAIHGSRTQTDKQAFTVLVKCQASRSLFPRKKGEQLACCCSSNGFMTRG